MQNNFEKNVQQKMDGLKLTPSATVWERVELEIKPERKKRRGVFWLLFVGLLFSGAWLLQQSAEESNKEALEKDAKQLHHEATAEAPIIAIDTAENKQSNGPGKASPPINIAVTKGAAMVDEKTKPIKISSFIVRRKASFETQPSGVTMKTSANKKPQAAPVVITAKTDAAPIESKNTKAVPRLDSIVTQTISTSSLNTDSIATKEEKVALPPGIDSTAKNKDSVLKKKVASTSNGWKRQISLAAGSSWYASGVVGQMAASTNYQSLPPGLITAPVSERKASKGISFSIGVRQSKALSKKVQLSIGLAYAYYSTRQVVGTASRSDTIARALFNVADAGTAIFTSAGVRNYTNRFHYLEVPVSFSYQPFAKLPVSFAIGVAYGRLLAGDAFSYDKSLNVYYRSRQNLRCNSLPLSASVQLRLRGAKSQPLVIGPYIQYDPLRLQKQNASFVPHTAVAGVQTFINF